MIPPPRNILVSYHYFRRYNLDKLAGMRIIGDSGAFSAKSQGAEVTLPELAAWGKRWQHRLCWLASLDVIGDAAGSRRNWHQLVDVHGLQAVPTIHFGGDPSLMDYYAERGVDFIGLGGMVGKPTASQLRWLVSCFRYARDNHPQVRFHGWGVSHLKIMRLPFFSVDSSGWSGSYRYGRMTLRDPTRPGHSVSVRMDGRGTYTPEIATLLREHYGVSPSQVSTSGPHNRKLVVQLSALSASVAEQEFRRIHKGGVTAPCWGQLLPARCGPAYHLAIGDTTKEPDSLVGLAGPHLHLAEGYSEHLELVGDMAAPYLHLPIKDDHVVPLTHMNGVRT